MNRPLLALLALTFALTGCATLNHRDRAFLESHGVSSGPVYDKMMHHEPLALDDIIELSRKGIPDRSSSTIFARPMRSTT